MLWRHSRGRGTRRSTPIASPCCDGAAWPAQEGREAMGDVVALRQAKAEDEKLAAAADTKLAAGDDGVNNRYGGGLRVGANPRCSRQEKQRMEMGQL
jgi:hypothetical protein